MVADEFRNIGGGNRVYVASVYDRKAKVTLFITVDDFDSSDCHMSLSTVDFTDCEQVDDDMPIQEIQYDAASYDETDEESRLFDYCWEQYIANFCSVTGEHMFVDFESLPHSLYVQLADEYKDWLDTNGQLVELDGLRIVENNNYHYCSY